MSRIYPMEDTSLYPPRRYRSNSDYESINEEPSISQNTENNVNNVNNINITRNRISATSGDDTNIRQSQNQNSNSNNNSIQTEIRHYYIRRNNTRGNHRGQSYSIQSIPSDRRNNIRRQNERLLNERSSNSINRNASNRNNIISRNNITNENQKCIICQSDDDDLILSKICICWSSYVCYPCMENMATRNIINCPICRRKLKYNLKSKTGTNIKNISYILLPYLFNLVGLIIIPIWFFESFFFQKENTKLQQDYRNINYNNDVLTLLCTPTLFLLIILFNKIIMYPFNIILFKTTALYYNYPREVILPLDFRCNFSKMYMYALLSYESLYIIICCLIDEYRISALHQYFVFNIMLYTVPFLVMALCFILIGIHNTLVRIKNKIERYIEYNVQSVHMNKNNTREEQVLHRRMEIINALDNLDDEEEDTIDINRLEEEILNEIYESSNH